MTYAYEEASKVNSSANQLAHIADDIERGDHLKGNTNDRR